jgi:hypothetical protein
VSSHVLPETVASPPPTAAAPTRGGGGGGGGGGDTAVEQQHHHHSKKVCFSGGFPTSIRSPHGVLMTTLMTSLLCERCLKHSQLLSVDLEPTLSELKSKISKITTHKMMPVRRVISAFSMLLQNNEQHWVMAPLRYLFFFSS